MSILKNLFNKNNKVNSNTNNNYNYGSSDVHRIDVDERAVSMLRKRYIAFDVETTGLSASSDRIVEIGAVIFENGQIINTFGTLVKSEIPISPGASAVNHITNDMLRNAPSEREVFSALVAFLGDALNGQTAICAHNASFDMGFLTAALSRLGYNSTIYYVDTLSLARKLIKGSPNYKQETLASAFGLNVGNAHRALDDAVVCGNILWRLLKISENQHRIEEERIIQKKEESRPSEEELEVCAFITDVIRKSNSDVNWLRFRRTSSSSIECSCLYSFLHFKFAKKGRYIIVPYSVAEKTDLVVEPATMTEGGNDYKRVYFQSPMDLAIIADYICNKYRETYNSMREFAYYDEQSFNEAKNSIAMLTWISEEQTNRILDIVNKNDYSKVPVPIVEPTITVSDVTINAKNNRKPIEHIRIVEYWGDDVINTWQRAEEYRKAGLFEEAIVLYEQCRECGVIQPFVYSSFAKAYHSLKDYDNEIVILNEGINNMDASRASELIARRDAAVKTLYKKQEAERIAELKKQAKEKKKEVSPSECDANIPIERNDTKPVSQQRENRSGGRAIYKMNDEGQILEEYETVSAASASVGVSTKSIRDAAKGVQKHAGGFVWRYKDELEQQ